MLVEKKNNINFMPVDLRVEYMTNPIGIDELLPRFSWKFAQYGRGQAQTAYQILVSSQRAYLQKGDYDKWDSGKVSSDKNFNIAYEGKKLESGKTYFWKVFIWDKAGNVSHFSSIYFFEMGLLDKNDWNGSWIMWKGKGGGILRKELNINKRLKKARAYISGLGYYELRLNGSKVGDRVLDPGMTNYDKKILYSTYDLTPLINSGKNALGVMLGNGKFSTGCNINDNTPHEFKIYNKSPILLIQVNLEFVDGSNMSIFSETTWKANRGPISFDDICDGEIYDARQEEPGWDCPGFDDSKWDNAVIAVKPKGKLVSQVLIPPIKICKKLKPKKISTTGNGIFIIDFGQNFSGWVKVKAEGKKGEKLKMRYAELLNENNDLNRSTNRDAKAEDTYIFKGADKEFYEPRFTYHGFRYVEISGLMHQPKIDDIEGCFVHTAVENAGSFKCSNTLINKIHKNILWGQLSNLISIPTDSPQRDERLGWLGDAHLTCEEAIHNFDMAGFYTKFTGDIGDSQSESGEIYDIAPPYRDIYPADPAWGSAFIEIPWKVYLYYGDKLILEKNYLLIKKYIDFLHSISEKGIVKFGKYGDWCKPCQVSANENQISLISTWYYYHDTYIFSKIAKVLRKIKDHRNYQNRAFEIKEAFNSKFLRDDFYSENDIDWLKNILASTETPEQRENTLSYLKKIFGTNSQTANALALFLDMVPPENKGAVLENLVNDIKVVCGGHLNTGIIGTRYLLEVLSENNQAEVAYNIANQKTYPGWGYMVKEGATTLWERWEYLDNTGMNSHNHIMFGSVDAWFYRVIAGIKMDPDFPGFKRFIIRPKILSDLKFASASLKTMTGKVEVSWQKKNKSIELQATIPVNSKAIVSIPKNGLKNVKVKLDGIYIWKNPERKNQVTGINDIFEEKDYITMDLESGMYEFKLEEG